MPSRQQLSQREIDHVLGEYALGAIHSISELAAGSVYSPKVVIESQRGKLLLKRRARGLDFPAVVAFSHEVISGCLGQGMCVPPLLGTRDKNSMVQFEDQVYELFVFIEGTVFDRSSAMIQSHAQQAGALLGELHRSLDSIATTFEAPTEPTTIDLSRLSILETQQSSISLETREHCKRILEYGAELAQANAQPPALVHGDWHPGNMIYIGSEIVAVCDFDNTRVGSRAREIAQAMVHFSLKSPAPGQTARNCDPDPEINAMRAFWQGYAGSGAPACTARLCVGLMPATMIDEALASLSSSHQSDFNEQSASMLIAVARKAIWLDEHQSSLISMLESSNQ